MDAGTDEAFFTAVVNDLRARGSHGELSGHDDKSLVAAA